MSLAIWHEPSSKENAYELLSCELHFNLWKFLYEFRFRQPFNLFRRSTRFLDIGIKLSNLGDNDSISIYFPFVISMEDISDLGPIIGNNQDLCSAILNTECDITISDHATRFRIQTSEDNTSFTIVNSQIELDNESNNTCIKITPDKKGVDGDIYIRIRITSKGVKHFFNGIRSEHSDLGSIYTISEIIDFRLNEPRSLPVKIRKKLLENGFSIPKIHLFYLCSSKEQYVFSASQLLGCRKLENQIWKKYCNGIRYSENILAYHWKTQSKSKSVLGQNGTIVEVKSKDDRGPSNFVSEKTVNHWNVLIRTQNDKRQLTKYLLWFTIITILLNFVSDCIFNGLPGRSNETNKQNKTISSKVVEKSEAERKIR